jgi:L-threonylcarbamoyladenylate synthase
MTARVVRDDDPGRTAAVGVLLAGGIVALPTDTVYGIAVALSAPNGIERLFAAKRRPPEKAVMLLLDDADQAPEAGVMTAVASTLADAFWPGGLSIVVAQRRDVAWPATLTGGAPTIGLRVPRHDAPRVLARGVGPLPTTSANVSGLPEAADADEIVSQLGDGVDLVIDGGRAHGGPASTVIDCSGALPRILRLGAVPLEELAWERDRAGLEHTLRDAAPGAETGP